MKRFITYLYEYQNGIKMKNVGFIRVDIRGNVVNMEICVQKLHNQKEGCIAGIVDFDGLVGLELGKLPLSEEQGTIQLQLSVRNLLGKPFSMDDIVGIGIRFEGGVYIASCWKDDYAEALAWGNYRSWEDAVQQDTMSVQPIREEDTMMIPEVVMQQDISIAEEEMTQEASVQNPTEEVQSEIIMQQEDEQYPYVYRKLDLTHMHMLPMQDRHYNSNAFLVHGFWNYGYVVLKTEFKEDKKKSWLGVPGIYERPEAAMALAFGFPLFEAIPAELVETPLNKEMRFSEKEMRTRSFCLQEAQGTLKNQHTNEKLFGCWFVELHE